ncbi:MAG: Tex-like N-terminal domain-containing protein, partial [Clostridia bacterium]
MHGKLTDEIKLNILNARVLTELEDIYRPYKQKKRTRATIGKEKGLEPLAIYILKQNRNDTNIDDICSKYINDDVKTTEEALSYASDIIAEDISDNAEYRKQIRRISYMTGKLVTVATKIDEKSTYDMYYNFSENINRIPSHRLLAINRGEKEEFLKVKLEVNEEDIIKYLNSVILKGESIYKNILIDTISDSYKRLIKPSIEREIRSDKFEEASDIAINVFGINVKNLFLGAPLKDMTIMGFDPAYRTGCKIA